MSRIASLLFLLLASVVLASAAHAAPASPFQPLLDVEVGDYEDSTVEAEWEDEEVEVEEEVIDEVAEEWEAWEEGGEPPLDCVLRSAVGKATLSPDGDTLRLTVRYAAYEPVAAAIETKLRGPKGTLRLPDSQERLGKRGVLRLSEPLDEGDERRVRAAAEVTVRFRIGAAPEECRPLLSRSLTIREADGKQLSWLQSDSAFGSL